MSTLFRIFGIVREKESGIGIGNLLVKAYDKDLIFDDLMGAAITRSDGKFEIISEASDFRDFFEVRPDIYLKILTHDSKRTIYSTKTSVRWNAGRTEFFQVDIPKVNLGDLSPKISGVLSDEKGEVRKEYDVGESLIFGVRGLVPVHVYNVEVTDDKGKIVTSSRLITDRNGHLPSNVVWPQLGVGNANEAYSFESYDEAERNLAGREFTVAVKDGDSRIMTAPFHIAESARHRVIYSSNKSGHLVNGIEQGRADIYVTGRNFPEATTVRIYMVRRQFSWQTGNSFVPVILIGGREATGTVNLKKGQTQFTVRIAAAGEVEPGSYDFIARIYRSGFNSVDEMILQEQDVISSRLLTTLVVRQEFFSSKTVLGGCVNAMDIAGRPVSGQPYFQFTNSFPVGSDVWAALDPAGIDPSLIGKKAAIYVIQHKEAGDWSIDNSLSHLSEIGGTTAVQEFVTQASCINFNERLIWPNATKPGKYDIVIDFGNNPAQVADFKRDDHFNPPLDIIDGYFVPGFNVVEDPGTMGTFPVGSFEYNEGNTVIDAPGEYDTSLPAGQQTDHHNLEQKAVVYFPADVQGAVDPSQISSAQAQYPLIVVIHGNSSAQNSYRGYNYLLEHLARNGFIAASIHIYWPNPPTWSAAKGISRARALFKHLEILKNKFPGKIDENNIGIMGHSRGGEAVVLASKLNVDENHGFNFKALISLAPTDQYGPISLAGPYHHPFLVIYGSLDGDLVDGPAFRLYDRADPQKSMLFVEAACHDRFNTEWDDNDFYFQPPPWGLPPADQNKVISQDAHMKIAKAYMNAFFLGHLYGKTEMFDYFKGEIVPPAVKVADAGSVVIHHQHHVPGSRIVDAFNNLNWQLNDLNGAVTDNGSLPAQPLEASLKNIDTYSPHDTKGGDIQWNATTGIYLSNIPAVNKDISGYTMVSFRISQRYGSAMNPAQGQQDFYVKLTDENGKSRAIKASKFGTIPYPYVRGYNDLTKSALKTIRIPLAAYTIKVLGMEIVDLKKIVSIAFEFKAKPTGEIEIDDIEFTT